MQEEIYKNLSPEDLPGEVWKDVVGYEGVYKISNKGRLSSFKSGSWKILSEINKKGGYLSVVLKHENKIKSARIHRLVYTSFVGEIPNLPISYIHHKDGNKQNNCVCNLELLTPCEHSKFID